MQSHRIDWRSEFGKLKPYIAGKGGIVRIRYPGDRSGWLRFDGILKADYAAAGPGRASIRIDPEWHTTHLVEDILTEFELKLEALGCPCSASPGSSARLSLLSNNQFDGDAKIEMRNVYIAEGPQNRARARVERLVQIAAMLTQLLDAGDRLMVVVHHAPAKQQNQFWRQIWAGGLAALVAKGLFLVHLCADEQDDRSRESPAPELELFLPGDFRDESRQDQAYDDLYEVFQSAGLDGDAASAAASVHLTNNIDNVAALHDNLFAVLLRIGQQRQAR